MESEVIICQNHTIKGSAYVDYKKFYEYFKDLYGTGLNITGWHLNGEAEPFDNFFESAIEYADVGKSVKDLWDEFGDVPSMIIIPDNEDHKFHFPDYMKDEECYWEEYQKDMKVECLSNWIDWFPKNCGQALGGE